MLPVRCFPPILALWLAGCGGAKSSAPWATGPVDPCAEAAADADGATPEDTARPDSATPDSSTSATDTATTTPGTGSCDSGVESAVLPELTAPLVIHAVRHAEKESEGSDPGLTAEGQARAEALAVVLADAPLAGVYATELRRTQDTVRPTADAHSLSIDTSVDPEEGLAIHLIGRHAGETVLHAGHSYTLPDFFEALGLSPVPEVDGYGQLWTIYLSPDAAPRYEEGFFGEESTAELR